MLILSMTLTSRCCCWVAVVCYSGAALLIRDEDRFSQYIQSAIIGAYLVSQSFVHRFEVFYWRERDDEVDFILRKKSSVIAIEVKSNAEKKTAGLEKFKQLFQPNKAFIVGDGGISIEDFLSMDIRKLF